MPLTSNQKHYIKKNIKKLSVEEITANLGISEKEICKFIKKRWGEDKFNKITNKKTDAFGQFSAETENLKSFFSNNIFYFIALFFLIGLVYFNSLHNDFVSDDVTTILRNPQIGNFESTLTSWMVGSGHNLTNFIIFKIFGLNPLPFRLLNILLHLGSTWIVFLLVSTLANRRVAIITSALFAVHPILIESVTWISGGPYTLYGFFALLSLFFYIRSENSKKLYYASAVSFLLALWSSDKIIFFPLILIIYELSIGKLGKHWKKVFPFAIIDGVVTIKAFLAIGNRVSEIQSVSYQDASGTQSLITKVPTAIATYLKLIAWPEKLSLYQTELNFSILAYILFLIISAILFGLWIYGWKKNRNVFFWLSFFVITISPTLTPFKISWVVAERYVYLGSIGIFVVFSMFFVWLMEKIGEKYKYVFYGVMILIVAALSARTIYRNIDWKDEDHLWPATAKVASSGPNIHNNMGDVYARNGELEKASEEFKKAIEINPNYGDAYHNLANTYTSLGQTDLAIENYQKALSINPNIWQSHQNLASIYYSIGNYQKAYDEISKAIEINPGSQDLQKNKEMVEQAMGKQ